MPRRKELVSFYLEPEALKRLHDLSARTRVPMSAYVREAVDDLLEKRAPKEEAGAVK